MAYDPFIKYYLYGLYKGHFPKNKRKLTNLLKDLFRDAHSIEDITSQIVIESLSKMRKKVRKLDPVTLVEDLLNKLHLDFETQKVIFDVKSV